MNAKTSGSEAKVIRFPRSARVEVCVTLWEGHGCPDETRLRERLAADGYQVVKWSNQPAQGYPPHAHLYPEMLWLLSGSLTVILSAENKMLELMPGDRVEVGHGVSHGTMAGADGAVYLLATR